MNSTAPELPPTTHHEQASGGSIFWALSSLALSAMTQPSFCGYVLSGDAFSAALSPHRSSPFVCLMDASVDLWTIRGHLRRGIDQQHRTINDGIRRGAPARTTAAIANLALLGLGVLPPALKLFGTSGIPRSQLLGAVFLASTLMSVARTLLTGAPSQQELADITNELGARSEDGSRLALTTKEELFQPIVLPHTFCLLLAWSRIGRQVDLGMPKDIPNAIGWIGVCVCWTFCAYAAQHTFFIVVLGRWILPRFPLLALTGAVYLLLAYYELLQSRADRHVEQYSAFRPLAIVLLGHAALCSFALASLLRRSMQRLFTKFTRLSDTGIASAPRAQSRHHIAVAADENEESGHPFPLSSVGPVPEPADAGDIGLAALSQQLQHTTASPDIRNASASDKPTYRWRLKTEAEAKRDFPLASRALHTLVSPATEDAERHRAQCVEEGHNPNAFPAAPQAALWKRLALYTLWFIVIVIYRLGLTVYSTYRYGHDWTMFHLAPLQGETGWLGLAMLNALTAAAYYFAAFEAEGTAAPGWTQALG